jgi:acyl phosphate:glycerol-3-phosphate acyltransferase
VALPIAQMSRIIIIAAVSYLLGSIPFGYLLVRMFQGVDVREGGSGSIGATNVARRSPALGVLTLMLDALKGSAAVALAYLLSGRMGIGPTPYSLMSLAAFCAIAGHVFTVWLKFRGGKGVATGLGSFLMIAPNAVLIAAAVFLVTVILFRYVSLGSILAVAVFPALVWLRHLYGNDWLTLLFIGLSSLLIIVKHHENIRRLIAGTEHRFGSKKV